MAKDPRSAGPRPPFPRQQQPAPGTTHALEPKADHGENSYRGHGWFPGCSVLITGGDSGIGRAVAIAFAREGADVLISYLDEHDDARETGEWVTQAGRRVVLVPGDVGDEAHCKELVKTAMTEFGRLDILINNAAFQRTHTDLAEFTAEEVEHTFRTNIESMFFLSREAAGQMRPGSSIINTASIQADHPSPELLAYASTKGAIANFTSALAQLLTKKGIRVNAVAPGPVWTPLIPSTMPPEKVEKFGANTPLGRPAQPAELAPAYTFLASDEATFISGAILPVTGGRPMM
ncbi:MAG TPA: glucose 1-dehydrogenase [Steroidobacteraceae bacterium]|jgi:NAD(P)-dependent dehydrogenase (short-subunit alcohol dehydrogenase family)|nr:glucose 1-dehydrogenase [Steroidobacteraceae bacterium]